MNSEPPSAMPPDDDKDLSGLGRDLLGGSTPASGSNPKAGWQPPTVEELHAILPQYEVSRMLGRGGMGAVYMGRQISLDRPVAIKILSGALEEDDFGFKERFKNEARAMAKLSHPGIIAVHDFGETADGLLYIVMEYVDGTDVARMIAAEGRLHTEHAMAITAHVCDALAYAHARGIIHRDIKPANIMVGYDGVVKVADFGLAKVHAGEGQTIGLTMSGMAMGTMHFIAPEALEYGATVDHRADLYAVGVMLFQMLTGKLPQGMFKMPSLQVPGMDPRYDGIITRAMYEDREARYQTATELRADLDGILTQPVEKVEAEDYKPAAALPTMARPQRPGGRKKGVTGAKRSVPEKAESRGWGVWAAVLLVCGGGAAAWLYLGGGESIETKVVEQVSASPAPERAPESVESPTTPSSPSTLVSHASGPAVTKDEPFVNSLGMKFVPVPGTEVLFCIHETRFRDYAAYAAENPGINNEWKDQKIDGVEITDRPLDHPVGRVNWEETQAFCRWLSQKEGRTYRLPTDEEWSVAVGLGGREERSPGIAPIDLDGKITDLFPWGSEWPPPAGAGNYSDENYKEEAANHQGHLAGYDDGYRTTAPVMSYKPNPFGLYDMGGNVWEWVEDWRDRDQKIRVLRGTSLRESSRDFLLSSKRGSAPPVYRGFIFGSRIVVELPTETNKATPQIAAVPNPKDAEPTKSEPFTNSLGMKFVPVPITGGPTDGQSVLFSAWETRVQDYEVFAAATKRVWQKPSFAQEGSHPAVQMNVEDARAFCSWLTGMDRKSGKIRTTELYRLPTDHEWSCAVGVGDLESPTSSPGEKSKMIADVYPWGSVYPPLPSSGNFGGAEFLPDSGKSRKDSGHKDAHVNTAPVGSYAPNKFGIFDLGGNAWEWVDDYFDPAKKEGVLRGASFFDSGNVSLASAYRSPRDQVFRHWSFGFRVVLAEAKSPSANVGVSKDASKQTNSPTAPGSGEWKDLFDGTTLNGWTTSGDAEWKVEDGALVSEGGDKGGVYRKLSSPWFELTGEMMVSADGNGGVHFQMTRADGWSTGYEVQLTGSTNGHNAAGTGGLLKSGAENIRAAENLLPDGKFGKFRILVEPERVQVWIGETRTVDLPGKISSQEPNLLAISRWAKGRVAYRNLRLRYKPESAASAPDTPGPNSTSSPNLPEVLTRIANYQKARHTQLSELTAKYRAALVSARGAATKSGVLDEVVVTDSAITAATTLEELIEKNRGATKVVPLAPLASPGESAPARLAELHKIFVSEFLKIEATLTTGLDQSLEAAQVALVQASSTRHGLWRPIGSK